MFTIFTLNITLGLIVAYFGRRRKIGFWGLFFGSILLTPVIGFLIFCVTDDVPRETRR